MINPAPDELSTKRNGLHQQPLPGGHRCGVHLESSPTDPTATSTTTTAPQTLDGTRSSLCTMTSHEHDPAAFHNGWRGRFNSWFFITFDRYISHAGRTHKLGAFGDLEPGAIVEIGAGVGSNFDFIPAGSRLVVIEPNMAMQPDLLERASNRNIDLEVHTAVAERMPLDDSSVDDVLCSLVLCTVADQDAVLGEIRRVLRPGGRFRFVEHVAAPRWSPRRWLQSVLRRPWSWLYEGCDICRNTAAAINDAGFARVRITQRRLRHSLFIPVNTAIYGVATK